MAIQWSSYSYGSNQYNGLRVGVEVSWSRVTTASTKAVATFKTYTQAVGAYDDRQHLAFGGGFNSGPDFDFEQNSSNGSNPAVLRSTRTYTYTYPASSYGGSPGGGTFSVKLSGAYDGASPGITVRSEIPARPIGEPLSPSSMTATRVSDSTTDLKWSNRASSGRPYSTIAVHQRDWQGTSWGGYRRVATLSGSATAYRVTGLSANMLYEWQVDAHNDAGRSPVVGASAVNTTPAPPTEVTTKISADGGSTVTSWTSNVYGAPNSDGAALDHSFIVERATIAEDGSTTWARVASGVQSPWTDPTPHAGQNQYRVAAKSDVYAPLVSAWTVGNAVSTIVPPLAPKLLAPLGVPVDAWFEGVTLSWDHVDGGDRVDQTAAEVEVSLDGGTTWTSDLTPNPGAVEQAVIPAGQIPNGAPVMWRVRTQSVPSKGFGPWSIAATFDAATRPKVTITQPTEVTTTGTMPVAWTYTLPAGDWSETSPQAEWEATLREQGSSVLETLSGFGADTSAQFTTRLRNEQAYTVTVRVRAENGLWSAPVDQVTTVDFPDPAMVHVVPTFRPADGTVSLRLTPLPPEPGEDPVVAVTVERRINDDSEWVELAVDVPLPVELIDPLPTLAGQNHYRVTSISAIPTYRTNPTATLHTPSNAVNAGAAPPMRDYGFIPWVRVNTGAAWVDSEAFWGNLSVDSRTARTSTTYTFLRRPRPVAVFGVNRSREISVSGRLTWAAQDPRRDSSSARAWEELGWNAALVCLRDPMGHRIFGVIGDVSVKHVSPTAADVSLTVTETDYVEAYGAVIVGDVEAPDDLTIQLLPEGGFRADGEFSVNDNKDGTWVISSKKVTDYGQPSGIWSAEETR